MSISDICERSVRGKITAQRSTPSTVRPLTTPFPLPLGSGYVKSAASP